MYKRQVQGSTRTVVSEEEEEEEQYEQTLDDVYIPTKVRFTDRIPVLCLCVWCVFWTTVLNLTKCYVRMYVQSFYIHSTNTVFSNIPLVFYFFIPVFREDDSRDRRLTIRKAFCLLTTVHDYF